MGQSGVGKTSLIVRYRCNLFSQTRCPTIGTESETATVIVDGAEIRLALWDTGGHEQFIKITQLIARDSHCGVFVASCDDEDSFLELTKHVKAFFEVNPNNCPTILAVNKVDVPDENWMKTRNAIEAEFGEKFSRVFFVSAQLGIDVKDMLECAAVIAQEYRLTRKETHTIDLNQTKKGDNNRCNC
jgi:small GTP-binding protein